MQKRKSQPNSHNKIVGGTRYSFMAENGEIPHQCKSKANYEVIALGEEAAREKQNKSDIIKFSAL